MATGRKKMSDHGDAEAGKDGKPALPLTAQQQAILQTTGNIIINAVAGSGKTTTIIEYAVSRPGGSRILYLAFNKSVKLEAGSKFRSRGLHQVTVETAHSLAYRHIIPANGFKVRAQGFKTHEIAAILGLASHGEKHGEYVIANHINKFVTYFCNSDKEKVQDLDYLQTITDKKARNFAGSLYGIIEKGTRQLLAMMDRGEIPVTHDFYLKKFQLARPRLPYDYILFDEGQDASPAMLDVFLRQDAVKILVGDAHQQIYSWRHAVNSLEKTGFQVLHLSASFRFRQDIADLAGAILDWKHHLGKFSRPAITGHGSGKEQVTRATLARTNLGLLLNAIGFITDNWKTRHIYFEGNINSYTYADDGASLYDVLNLFNHQRSRIRDKLIASMNSMDDLEEYIEKTEDPQLSMMVEIVKEYGNEIPGLIKSLKDRHTGDEDRSKAEMIFSTVHRAKGMEYDVVHLVNDFISESRLEKTIGEQEKNKEPVNTVKLLEEINLLYVAVTRTRNRLFLPAPLLPRGVATSKDIIIVPEEKKTPAGNTGKTIPFFERLREKKSFNNTRTSPNGRKGLSSTPWSLEQEEELIELYSRGYSVSEMAEHFSRTKGAIISLLKRKGYVADGL